MYVCVLNYWIPSRLCFAQFICQICSPSLQLWGPLRGCLPLVYPQPCLFHQLGCSEGPSLVPRVHWPRVHHWASLPCMWPSRPHPSSWCNFQLSDPHPSNRDQVIQKSFTNPLHSCSYFFLGWGAVCSILPTSWMAPHAILPMCKDFESYTLARFQLLEDWPSRISKLAQQFFFFLLFRRGWNNLGFPTSDVASRKKHHYQHHFIREKTSELKINWAGYNLRINWSDGPSNSYIWFMKLTMLPSFPHLPVPGENSQRLTGPSVWKPRPGSR